MLLYGPPKCGKTTALSYLDNCLIIDTEGGSDYVEALKIKAADISELKKIVQEIIKEKKPYKYIAIDTLSEVEDGMALDVAAGLYKSSSIGKNWAGKPDEILNLANGLGYYYLRRAIDNIIDMVTKGLPDDGTIILIAHLRDKLITTKDGSDVLASDIALTGRIKEMVSRKVDIVGYVTFKPGSSTIKISFNSADGHTGSRVRHIAGKVVDVIKFDKDGNVTENNWNEVLK